MTKAQGMFGYEKQKVTQKLDIAVLHDNFSYIFPLESSGKCETWPTNGNLSERRSRQPSHSKPAPLPKTPELLFPVLGLLESFGESNTWIIFQLISTNTIYHQYIKPFDYFKSAPQTRIAPYSKLFNFQVQLLTAACDSKSCHHQYWACPLNEHLPSKTHFKPSSKNKSQE